MSFTNPTNKNNIISFHVLYLLPIQSIKDNIISFHVLFHLSKYNLL